MMKWPQWPEISGIAPVLEETVFLQYEDQQSIVTLRGIPESYLPFLGLDSHIYEGDLTLKFREMPGALVGYGIADNLKSILRSGCRINQSICGKAGRSKIVEPASKV